MAARALWKGAISFGLVHIPVEMYSAVQEHELDLTMLDRRDFRRSATSAITRAPARK